MKIVGITGGIASGKSTVVSYLKSLGYSILDSDQIAHQVLKTPRVIEQVRRRFGEKVLEEGQVNRTLLGKLIFSDEQAKLDLNAIVHPEVIQEVQEEINNFTGDILFVDVPLLYEAKMDTMMDLVVVVYVDFSTQLKRLTSRDHIDEDYALQKINAQMNLGEKAKRADFVVDNTKGLMETYSQVDEILRRIQNEI